MLGVAPCPHSYRENCKGSSLDSSAIPAPVLPTAYSSSGPHSPCQTLLLAFVHFLQSHSNLEEPGCQISHSTLVRIQTRASSQSRAYAVLVGQRLPRLLHVQCYLLLTQLLKSGELSYQSHITLPPPTVIIHTWPPLPQHQWEEFLLVVRVLYCFHRDYCRGAGGAIPSSPKMNQNMC